jgi:hypothetical protein
VLTGETDPGVADPVGVTVPGFVTGEVPVPVQPAKATAPDRSTITIMVNLNCISERASLSYIMLVLGKMPGNLRSRREIRKYQKPDLDFLLTKNTVRAEKTKVIFRVFP